MIKTIVIIPARWESKRLPGKPLAMIGNKPMIQHTWEKAIKSEADEVIIATDSKAIYESAMDFGARVIWTPEFDTGTERVIAIQKIKGADYVINVQGDEPFINPNDINRVIDIVKSYPKHVATLKTDLTKMEETDANAVKVVTDQRGSALMFTRSSVYINDDHHENKTTFKHIGIYGYSSETLNKISEMQPSENAINNSLEQLTWMDNNISIMTGYTSHNSFGVDTPSDLKLANKIYGS